MAGDELQFISLRDDFYRDGYYKALAAVGILLIAIALLISASLYLQLSKPDPVAFATGDEFRTLLPVPVNEPYISQPDLIQWVSEVIPKIFTFDFINYTQQLENVSQYFTSNGWKNYSELLKLYAVDSKTVVDSKLFTNGTLAGAPFIFNQGILVSDAPGAPKNTYSWLIQMPFNLGYSSTNKGSTTPLMIQALVVRVPTLNNLSGVAIENLTVTKGAGDQVISNG